MKVKIIQLFSSNWMVFFLLLIPMITLAQKEEILGYRYKNLKELRKYTTEMIHTIELKPGEKLVSIGAANGWVETAMAVLLDSVDFYLEDIDSIYLNQRELDKLIAWNSKIKGAPLTCGFHLVLGSETGTNLPNASFNKIWMMHSYHHFSDIQSMLFDSKRILNPGGTLFVTEEIRKKSLKRRKQQENCKFYLKTETELIEEISAEGFFHEKTVKNHGGVTLIFTSN